MSESIEYASILKPFQCHKAFDAGVKYCCDKACFWRLMLERYTAAVSQEAPALMKFAAYGLVVWGAGEILQWWRSGNETNYFLRFRGSASIAWTHLKQFIISKEYHQDSRRLTWSPVCSVNDWTPVVPVIYACMNRFGVCHNRNYNTINSVDKSIGEVLIKLYKFILKFIFVKHKTEMSIKVAKSIGLQYKLNRFLPETILKTL